MFHVYIPNSTYKPIKVLILYIPYSFLNRISKIAVRELEVEREGERERERGGNWEEVEGWILVCIILLLMVVCDASVTSDIVDIVGCDRRILELFKASLNID